MTIVQFDKMHGLGNDFVVIDARVATVALTADVVLALGDRHTGIGFDQMIIVGNSTIADLSMRIFNADGSEVEACGNATRCVVSREGRDVTIETKAGLLHGQLSGCECVGRYGTAAFRLGGNPPSPMPWMRKICRWDGTKFRADFVSILAIRTSYFFCQMTTIQISPIWDQ